MAMPFNADEVLKMAERIEQNGSVFYRSAAQKFADVRENLLDLASMEDEHEKTFKEMREKLSKSEQESLVFDPDNQVQEYLQAMADDHVINLKADPLEQLEKINSVQELLRFAMGIERDSIAFYVGLKDSVTHRAGKDKIENIISEEISHIAVLHNLLTELKN